jgi:hypothetical protein
MAVMTALGHSRRFRDVRDMSGQPQTADISGPGRHFAFVPLSDITLAPRTIEDRTPWRPARIDPLIAASKAGVPSLVIRLVQRGESLR